MAVALRVGVEDGRVQAQRGRRVDRVHPVDLVDRLAAHDAPPAVASLKEVVKPPGAHDVDQHIVHEAPLADRHLRLGDRPGLLDVDRRAAQEVADLHPLGGSLAAGLDEVLIRALEPGGVHPGAVMPDRGEPFPVAAVAVQRPVLDQVADQQSVLWITHGLGPPARWGWRRGARNLTAGGRRLRTANSTPRTAGLRALVETQHGESRRRCLGRAGEPGYRRAGGDCLREIICTARMRVAGVDSHTKS
jgi:hypothetical protein